MNTSKKSRNTNLVLVMFVLALMTMGCQSTKTFKATEISTDYINVDAMHIPFPVENRESEFEWWYFDAALDNGDHMVVMYSTNDTRLNPRKPSVRTNIYEANGNEIAEIKEYDEKDVSVSYERLDATFGEEYFVDMGGYFELYTNINGNGAKLKLYPENPAWSQPATKKNMGWTVAVPQGRVECNVPNP